MNHVLLYLSIMIAKYVLVILNYQALWKRDNQFVARPTPASDRKGCPRHRLKMFPAER